ncbi:hypothetical protein VNO78_23557 [Psophocarpus tetragonolobus]|uniref:Uncharacterized protein n=1 Tax=Psophocarpus tetragonolobus TaxID=3891 RepID=A0AAN9S4P5_PSOTE
MALVLVLWQVKNQGGLRGRDCGVVKRGRPSSGLLLNRRLMEKNGSAGVVDIGDVLESEMLCSIQRWNPQINYRQFGAVGGSEDDGASGIAISTLRGAYQDQFLWFIGKSIGASSKASDLEVLQRLEEMEIRDRGRAAKCRSGVMGAELVQHD